MTQRPIAQLSPFTAARGEVGTNTSVPVVGLNFKGAMVKLTTDETLVTSQGVVWDASVYDEGTWWNTASGGIFSVIANTRKVRLSMGAYLTPAVADMQFYALKNGVVMPGGGYSHTASGNVGFTWTSAPIDCVEGDVFEVIPEFAAGAPVLDADEAGGTWWAIEQISAVAPSTAPRGALLTIATDELTANYSAGKNVTVFDTTERDTDQLVDVNSAGVLSIGGGGITHIKLNASIGMGLCAAASVAVASFYKNGAIMDPSGEVRIEMANGDPSLQWSSPVLAVSSGDYFQVQLLQTDTSITLRANKCFFELEIVNPNYLANVDSYHGMFFPGVPTSEQETHRILAPFEFTVPSSCTGATGSVGIAPNSVEVWSFQKDAVEFATATISLSGDVSFQSSLEQNFGPSTNVLTFVAPNSGSAGDVSLVLRGAG